MRAWIVIVALLAGCEGVEIDTCPGVADLDSADWREIRARTADFRRIQSCDCPSGIVWTGIGPVELSACPGSDAYIGVCADGLEETYWPE